MKNYMKKKLGHFQIHRVISRSERGGDVLMRAIREPFVIDGVPEGHYVPLADGLLLPKRRRGEKFIVHYTTMNEVVF